MKIMKNIKQHNDCNYSEKKIQKRKEILLVETIQKINITLEVIKRT